MPVHVGLTGSSPLRLLPQLLHNANRPRLTRLSTRTRVLIAACSHRSTRPFSISYRMASGTPMKETPTPVDEEHRSIKEGKATILIPQGAKVGEDRGEVQQVFYNPIQRYNRDLSTLAIKTYAKDVVARRREAVRARSERLGKKRKRDEAEDGGSDEKTQAQVSDATEQVNENERALEGQDSREPHAQKPPFKILDALSASGLRALRYAQEVPYVTSVTANDLSASAAQSIKQNIDHNGVEDIVSVTNEDALAHMYRTIALDLGSRDRHGKSTKFHKYDVVDLDPYGSAAPFFDAAVQSVRDDGGLLCVTCTDSALWAGHSYAEKTFALYGGVPIKGLHSHEAGLRLILHAIATSAARYGLAIEPQLSLSIDYYTKLFVKVTKSQLAVKFHAAKTMMVYTCDSGCGSWETQPFLRSRPTPNKKGTGSFYKHSMAQGPTADRFCQHCGFRMHVGGPMFAGRIHSPEFINRLLEEASEVDPEVYQTLPRLEGMLKTALEELIPGPEVHQDVNPKEAQAAAIDHFPFFFLPNRMASVLSCSTPPENMVRGALLHLGYKVTRSHCRPGSIKTDAPWPTLWWVMTEWIRQKAPIKASNIKTSTAAWRILKRAGLVGVEEEAKGAVAGGQTTSTEGDAARAPPPGTQGAVPPVPPAEVEQRKTLFFNQDLASLGQETRGERIVRWQVNPEANWGPMSKAKRH